MKFFSLVFLFCIASSVSANQYQEGKISRMVVEGGNIVSVWLSGGTSNKTTDCSGGSRWTLHKDDKNFDAKYSLLLAASAQNKSVQFMHLTAHGCGTWNSNKIYYIDIRF